MRRDLPASAEGLEPDLRTVAERAARQAGMGLDEWIAATLKDRAARNVDASGSAERTAAAMRDALGAVGKRLNEIEQRSKNGPAPSRPDAGESGRPTPDGNGDDARRAATDGGVDALLHTLEQRVAAMQGRLTAPGARRGPDEVGSAVAEIRSRQTELDDGEPVRRAPAPSAAALARSHADALHSLKDDIARLFGALEDLRPAADAPNPDLAAVRDEMERLRDALGGLATRGEIGALEQVLRVLGERAAGARSAGDVEAVLGHLQTLQEEMRRLSSTVTTEVHERLGRDLDALSRKVDGVAGSGDRQAVDALSGRLDEVRSLVGEIADPRRIERLGEHVAALGRDVAAIAERQVDGGEFAALRSAVEDVRLVLKHPRPARSDPDTVRQLEVILQKLELIGDERPDLAAAANQIEAAAGRLGELTERLPRDGVDAIANRVDTLARRLEERTGIETLARHVEAIAKRVEARDDVGSVAGHLEAIYERLDERGGFDAMQRQVAALAQKLDTRERSQPDLLERIERLSTKLDRVAQDHQDTLARTTERLFDAAGAPFSDPSTAFAGLTERLDRIDDRLRQAGPDDDRLQPIEAMLGALADRLGQAGEPTGGAEALDALQQEVGRLARRLEAPSHDDPTLSTLQRSMGDLLAQMEALRDGALEAAERAAKVAVADTLGHMPLHGGSDLGPIRDDLEDLKFQTSAADRRVQDALEAVHRTLEAVASRLASLDKAAEAGPSGPDRASKARADWQEPAGDRRGIPETIRVSRAAAPPVSAIAAIADNEPDVPLEPGAERPRPGPRGAGASDPVVAEIKANLIAAARRAYLEGAAEAAATNGPGPAPAKDGPSAASGPARLAARLRSAVERRRRPLILGLTAVILAIGALQIGLPSVRKVPETVASAPPVAAPEPSAPGLPVRATAEAPAQPAQARPASPPEPRTTQAIAGRTPPDAALPAPTAGADGDRKAGAGPERIAALAAAGSEDAAGTLALPSAARGTPTPTPAAAAAPTRIGDMAGIAIPPTLTPSGLRQAAMAGDPAAVFEVGARAAEGRGIARDPALAARLFEKAAAHGNPSAQYRIGNQFEKGVGIGRDLVQAKRWYGRAAEGGNVRAMHNLAVLLAEGGGEKPDYATATQWFRRAAEHGVRDSQFNLGVLLARGLGTEQNLIRSYIWFAVAAAGGDADAGRKRDEIGERLAPADLAEAKLAAESWKPQAPAPAANEPPRPTQEWTDAAPQPKKTAGARV